MRRVAVQALALVGLWPLLPLGLPEVLVDFIEQLSHLLIVGDSDLVLDLLNTCD